jgi:hypothetical protein
MKYQQNFNAKKNSLKKTAKRILSPNYQMKLDYPIKIFNRNKSKLPREGIKSQVNNENINSINDTLFNSENARDDIYQEETTQNNLPILSTNTNINTIQSFRAKTAKASNERYKLKLENIESMFNTKPKFYIDRSNRIESLKKKFCLLPKIPDDLLPRLNFVFSLFNNPLLEQYVSKCPSKMQNDLKSISNYLWEYQSESRYKNLDKYVVFYYYLCQNIQYDVEKKNENEKDLEKVFKSGLANSFQFCKLFEFMCKKHLLRVKHISGYSKLKELPNFKIGANTNIINHHWNSIYVNNKWYLCDLTFGSGGIKKRSEFKQKYFNPFYFMSIPDMLIETHRPIEDIWQLTTKIIPLNQFSLKKDLFFGEFYKKVYEYDIKLITHEYPIINFNYCNKPLYIKLGLLDMSISGNLYLRNFRNKVGEIKFNFDDKNNIFILEPVFPENGEYWLEILFREFTSSENQYSPLINYKIIVDDTQEKYLENLKKEKLKEEKKKKMMNELNKKRPKSVKISYINGTIIENKDMIKYKKHKVICLDNEGAHLITPFSNNIKIGQENEFKIKVPGSEGVCVLDGRNFNYLKRMKKDKNTWIGKVLIKNENISVLSMKDNSLFTEVFQLKARYTSSNLLKAKNIREKLYNSAKKAKHEKIKI